MAHIDTYNLVFGEPGFRSRVIGGAIASAEYVLAEDPGTANHAARVAWALDFLVQQGDFAERLYRLVAADGTISANGTASTDGQIDSALAAVLGSATLLAALGYS